MNTRRRGFTMLEILTAICLLGVLTTVSVQFLRGAADQRRAILQRQTALQEAASTMEHLGALAWDQLGPDAAAGVRLSPQAIEALPEGQVEVKIDAPSGEKGTVPFSLRENRDSPPAKRIRVVVRWHPAPEQPARTVQLVAWRYKTRD